MTNRMYTAYFAGGEDGHDWQYNFEGESDESVLADIRTRFDKCTLLKLVEIVERAVDLDNPVAPVRHYLATLRWVQEPVEFQMGTVADNDEDAIAYFKRVYVDKPEEYRAELLALCEDTWRRVKL